MSDAPHDSKPPGDRSLGAWRAWLKALATDPEAALSAALVYEELPIDARSAWLDALEADVPSMEIPKVAAYAPLLAVEEDPVLRARIEREMGAIEGERIRRAFVGERTDGALVVVIASSLYLDFAELLITLLVPDARLLSVAHEPLVALSGLFDGMEMDGVKLRVRPLDDAVELVAHAVVAMRRAGDDLPEGTARFADLFTPGLAAAS